MGRKYASGIISLQIAVPSTKGFEYVLLDNKQKLSEGYDGWMWPGGFFVPSGNLFETVDKTQKMEGVGAKLISGTERLMNIVYSRTKSDRWIANYCISVQAAPISQWLNGYDRDNFLLASVHSFDPSKVNGFRWAINDGPRVASEIYRASMCFGTYRNPIPVVDVVGHANVSQNLGFALNVGSVVVPHTYRGKFGYVCIKNTDSPRKALIGGKVEVLNDTSSGNIDIVSCIVREAEEESGASLYPQSIIGTAITPKEFLPFGKDVLDRMEENSILNTCLVARPSNGRMMDEIIDSGMPPEAERSKIERVYFFPEDEWSDILKEGMRTPDMIPLMKLALNQSPSQRPNLESISVIHDSYPVKGLPETAFSRT